MLLLIDAGNTRIKWALADQAATPGAWLASGAVTHAGLGQLTQVWQGALGGRTIRRALLSNVAGAALRARLEQALPATLAPDGVSWFASQPQLAGVRNAYRDPFQLGCDRFAAAIGAHALAPGQAVIVATCGTATTIDALSADGVFLGGMILPGLGLMASSLARDTAQLPQIGLIAQGLMANSANPLARDTAQLPQIEQIALAMPPTFADNTDDAILYGCLAAQAGAIERACAAHSAALCLLSGGAAAFIAPGLTLPYRLVDNIVLIGLHAAASAGGD